MEAALYNSAGRIVEFSVDLSRIVNLENEETGYLALGYDITRQKRLKHGDLVVLASVGAGFTVGAAALRWHGFPWP